MPDKEEGLTIAEFRAVTPAEAVGGAEDGERFVRLQLAVETDNNPQGEEVSFCISLENAEDFLIQLTKAVQSLKTL